MKRFLIYVSFALFGLSSQGFASSEVLTIDWLSASDGSDYTGRNYLTIEVCTQENNWTCHEVHRSKKVKIKKDTIDPEQKYSISAEELLKKFKEFFPSSVGIGNINISIYYVMSIFSDQVRSRSSIPYSDIQSKGDLVLDLNVASKNPYMSGVYHSLDFASTVEIKYQAQ